MTDITSTHLEAAILDQVVAGAFAGKTYAFTAVCGAEGGYRLGVAVKDEPGYCPIGGKDFADFLEAQRWASGLNEHIGLTDYAATLIVASTMGR